MVIGILILLSAFGLGLGVIRSLRTHFRPTETFALAIVVGHLTAAWLSFLCCWLLGYQVGLPVFVVSLVIASIWGYRKKRGGVEAEPWLHARFGYLVPGILVTLFGLLVYLTYTRYLQVSATGEYLSGGYTWGDLALHMTIATKTAAQQAFSWDFSLYPGNPLVYPFLPDYFVGILGRVGMAWGLAFTLVNSALVAAYFLLLFTLVERITKSITAGVLSVVLLVGSGSAVGMWIYMLGVRAGTAASWRVYDYTNQDEQAMHFASIVTSHILPQRTYLSAIGILLSIVILLWHNRQRGSLFLRVLALGLAVFLPFMHVHISLIALFLVAIEFTYQLLEHKRLPVPFLVIFSMLAIAAAQIVWQVTGAYSDSFSQVKFGWLTPEGASPVLFWIRQLGVFWILLPFGLYFLRKEKGMYVIALSIAALLFVVSNVYQFQPNLWDNMKFLTVAFTFALIPVSYALAKVMRGWWMLVGIPLLVASVGSGSLALAREAQNSFVLSTVEDIEITKIIQEKTPPDAVFVTSSNHNHPASMLAGRTILLGYPGWLWSYGIDTSERDREVREIFAASPKFEQIAQKYNARYVLIHKFEKPQYAFNQLYYSSSATLMAKAGNWELYKLPF